MGTVLSTGYDDGGSISISAYLVLISLLILRTFAAIRNFVMLTSMLSATSSHSVLLGVLTAFFRCLPRCWMCALLKLEDGWPESENDVCSAAYSIAAVKKGCWAKDKKEGDQ